MKKYSIIFSLVSIAIILCLGFNRFLHILPKELAVIPPTVKDSLSFSFSKIDAFNSQCENKIKQTEPLYKFLTRFKSNIKAHVFGVSPDRKNVVVGRNNRFFFAQTDLILFNGSFYFNQQEKETFKEIWECRKRYFDAKKIPFQCIIAPCGLNVYNEDLPLNIVPRKENSIVSIMKFMGPKLKNHFIYPINQLKSAKNKEQMYFRYDNHWSDQAGMLAVNEFYKRLNLYDLKINPLTRSAFQKKPRKRKGGVLADYYSKTDLVDFEVKNKYLNSVAEKVDYPTQFKSPEGFPYPDQFLYYYKNPRVKTGKKILIIRDSFGFAMYPILYEDFSETLIIWDSWQYKLNPDIVEDFKPDVVLFVVYEPHIKHILEEKNFQGEEKKLKGKGIR